MNFDLQCTVPRVSNAGKCPWPPPRDRRPDAGRTQTTTNFASRRVTRGVSQGRRLLSWCTHGVSSVGLISTSQSGPRDDDTKKEKQYIQQHTTDDGSSSARPELKRRTAPSPMMQLVSGLSGALLLVVCARKESSALHSFTYLVQQGHVQVSRLFSKFGRDADLNTRGELCFGWQIQGAGQSIPPNIDEITGELGRAFQYYS